MPNISQTLAHAIPDPHLALALSVGKACAGLGARAFLVGGTVRDVLMGQPGFGDLDIMVADPPPDPIRTIADAIGARTLKTSLFSTARLKVDGIDFDLAMARSETYRAPGALPDVAPGSVSDDLARRDFSINAMAVDLSPDAWGDLIDPHGGQRDLEAGILRTLHEHSFRDDGTRMVRAARYAARFGFSLEGSTLEQLRGALVHLRAITPARFRNELQQAFDEPDVPKVLGLLDAWGVLGEYLPGTTFERRSWTGFQGFRPDDPGRRRRVGFALLALSGQAASHPGLDARLALDAEAADAVRSALALRHTLADLDADGLRPSGLVKTLDRFHPDAIAAHAVAAADVSLSARLGLYLDTYRWVRPSLDGHEVIALGVPRGRSVGRVLARLRDARLDGELDSREEEVALVKRAVSRRQFFDREE